MYGLAPNDDAKGRLLATIPLILLALIFAALGFPSLQPQLTEDFEQCAERAQAESLSKDERGAAMMGCNARFAGRRKTGGGYTYYDFMQNRHFDISGPNPTAEERKQIDRAYMGFLDVQRREDISAELAIRQDEQLRASLESVRQPVGPSMALTPKNQPSSAAKRPRERSISPHCHDGSLTCSWAKLSAVVKNAFASSSKMKQ
jgi:hypothetical protein